MRLPNRYGTVYRLSGKNRRCPYVAKAFVGCENKHSVYCVLGYFKNKQEALETLVAYHSGRFSQSGNTTFKCLYEQWSSLHYKTVAPSTVRQYKAAWARLKIFENFNVTDLRTTHLQTVINNTAQTLKRGSLEKIKLLAVMLFDYAVQNDICQKNYATFVTLPKKEKTEKPIFSQTEISLLWQNLSLPFADTVIFMIYTGFRVGEMLSLRVGDVDLSSGFIKGGLKTIAGKNRIVPVHPRIKSIVTAWIKGKNKTTPIFDISYSKYSTEFKKLMSELKIKNKTPHCCRHTFATNMAKGGADVNALKTIIGHSSYAITADIYTHLCADDLVGAINVLV